MFPETFTHALFIEADGYYCERVSENMSAKDSYCHVAFKGFELLCPGTNMIGSEAILGPDPIQDSEMDLFCHVGLCIGIAMTFVVENFADYPQATKCLIHKLPTAKIAHQVKE